MGENPWFCYFRDAEIQGMTLEAVFLTLIMKNYFNQVQTLKDRYVWLTYNTMSKPVAPGGWPYKYTVSGLIWGYFQRDMVRQILQNWRTYIFQGLLHQHVLPNLQIPRPLRSLGSLVVSECPTMLPVFVPSPISPSSLVCKLIQFSHEPKSLFKFFFYFFECIAKHKEGVFKTIQIL